MRLRRREITVFIPMAGTGFLGCPSGCGRGIDGGPTSRPAGDGSAAGRQGIVGIAGCRNRLVEAMMN